MDREYEDYEEELEAEDLFDEISDERGLVEDLLDVEDEYIEDEDLAEDKIDIP